MTDWRRWWLRTFMRWTHATSGYGVIACQVVELAIDAYPHGIGCGSAAADDFGVSRSALSRSVTLLIKDGWLVSQTRGMVAFSPDSAPHVQGAAPDAQGAFATTVVLAPHVQGAIGSLASAPDIRGAAPDIRGADHLNGAPDIRGAAPDVRGAASAAPDIRGAGNPPHTPLLRELYRERESPSLTLPHGGPDRWGPAAEGSSQTVEGVLYLMHNGQWVRGSNGPDDVVVPVNSEPVNPPSEVRRVVETFRSLFPDHQAWEAQIEIYCRDYPADWVIEAIHQGRSFRNGITSAGAILTMLKRYRENGGPPKVNGFNGNGRGLSPSGRSGGRTGKYGRFGQPDSIVNAYINSGKKKDA